MELVMRMASLALAARSQANLKVRQPLAEVAFSVSSSAEAQSLLRHADLLMDELNVKHVRQLGSAGEAVSYSLKPLPKQLGQKYKALFPKVAKAINALNANQAGPSLLAGQTVQVVVDGASLEIQPDEVEVRLEARSGLVVVADGAYLAAIKTELTPELVSEGMAREFVRRVQELRKTADFDIADRIRLWLAATPTLSQAIQAHQEYILGETLTIELNLGTAPAEAATTTAEFDGETMTISIMRA